MNPNKILLLSLVALLFFAGCKKDDEGIDENKGLKTKELTLIMPTGSLGDGGYNNNVYRGVFQSAESFNLKFVVRLAESTEEADSIFCEWLKKDQPEKRALVFSDSRYESIVRGHKDSELRGRNILLLDVNDDSLPVYTAYIPLYGPCYATAAVVSHILSAMYGDDVRCAVLRANDKDLAMREGSAGFADRMALNNFGVCDIYTLSDASGTGYNMPDSVKNLCNSLNGNYNFAFPLCGHSSQGIYDFNTLNIGSSLMTCGIDSDVSNIYLSCILSVVKRVDQLIFDWCQAWCDEKDWPLHSVRGMNQGYSELVFADVWYPMMSTFANLDSISADAAMVEASYFNK